MNLTALRRVLANRNIRLALLGFSAFTLVLHGAWLATIIYAFDNGGTSEAGVVTVAVLVPAALLGPFVAVWFDRLRPNLALGAGFGLQGVGLVLVAAVVALDAPPIVTYFLVGLFSIVQMASRPNLSSILPRIVIEPSELTAANSAMGAVDTIGLVLGPAAAGLLLVSSDTHSVPFAVCRATMMVAAGLAMLIRTDALDPLEDEHSGVETTVAQVVGGIRLLRRDTASRRLLISMAAMRLIVGALDVGVVVIAVDHLGRTEASAGLLGAAIGVGAIVGSVLTFLLIGRRRLSMPLSFGLAAASLPLAAIAFTDTSAVVLGLLAIAGLGRPIVEVSGRSLLQGLSADDTLAQVFGLLEGVSLLVLAIGSAGFSFLTVVTSLSTALVVAGVVPCVVVLAQYANLRRIDDDRPDIDPVLLTLARGTPIFAPLAAFRLEQILINLKRHDTAAGEVVFAEGDVGDAFHLVADGSALITLEDREIETSRGGFFGEVALLRDQPRMATVRAGSSGLVSYTLSRQVFLDAIAAAPKSRHRTDHVVRQRLGED